jgi:hypothetical protein
MQIVGMADNTAGSQRQGVRQWDVRLIKEIVKHIMAYTSPDVFWQQSKVMKYAVLKVLRVRIIM